MLTYNLGTAAIRAAAQHGLVLERAYTPVQDGDHQHHYRYRVADSALRWSQWSAGEPLGSVSFVAPADSFRAPTAGRWWLVTRGAGVTMHAQTATVPDRLALRVSITPPEQWRGGAFSAPAWFEVPPAYRPHVGPS